jgi:hypothetical protein
VFNVGLTVKQQTDDFVSALEAGESQSCVSVGLDLGVDVTSHVEKQFHSSCKDQTGYLVPMAMQDCVPVWPFMAASISGEIPSLLPVRELISAPALRSSFMMLT